MKNLKELGGLASIVVVNPLDFAERDAERMVQERLRGEMERLRSAFLKGKDGEEGDRACLECKHCMPQVDREPQDFRTMDTRYRASLRCKAPGPCVNELARSVFSYRDGKMTTTTAPLAVDMPDHAVDAMTYAFDAMKDPLVAAKGGYGGLPPQPTGNRDLPATSVDAW